jgi:hypothetical protein
MANTYSDYAKDIANKFIQNIVFIDDEANLNTKDDGAHRLDSIEITKSFARSQKICAVYNPEKEDDLDDLISICKKADVVVLDWQITLDQPTIIGKEEEDSDTDDPRGKYTIQIIKKILSDEDTGKDSLKLIIVYTGETNLWGITKAIFDSLNAFDGIKQGDFSVFSNNFRIFVYGKPTLIAKHTGEIQDRIVDWNQLPDIILTEFTSMTYGLLSNVVLKALVAIRQKAFKLLKTFPSSVDSAFLGHKALLPNPEDAEEQLLDIIGSEIKSILKSYDSGFYLSKETINTFIVENLADKKYPFNIEQKENFRIIEIPDEIDRPTLNKFVEVGIENYFIKNSTPFVEKISFTNQCHRIITQLYSQSAELASNSNKQLALLTSVKTNYNPNVSPLLSLGSILKKEKGEDTYWLCLQPKCDAVRIEKTRNFLIVSLKKIEDENTKFDFLVIYQGATLFFKIDYSIYKTQFYSFKANRNKEVRGVFKNGKIVFEGNPDLEWIGDLKNDFSQSISNNFSTGLSRVGMDHSEWLRRSS